MTQVCLWCLWEHRTSLLEALPEPFPSREILTGLRSSSKVNLCDSRATQTKQLLPASLPCVSTFLRKCQLRQSAVRLGLGHFEFEEEVRSYRYWSLIELSRRKETILVCLRGDGHGDSKTMFSYNGAAFRTKLEVRDVLALRSDLGLYQGYLRHVRATRSIVDGFGAHKFTSGRYLGYLCRDMKWYMSLFRSVAEALQEKGQPDCPCPYTLSHCSCVSIVVSSFT